MIRELISTHDDRSCAIVFYYFMVTSGHERGQIKRAVWERRIVNCDVGGGRRGTCFATIYLLGNINRCLP
jgi:hypothetical protein